MVGHPPKEDTMSNLQKATLQAHTGPAKTLKVRKKRGRDDWAQRF